MTTRWFRLIQTMLLCAEAREEAERGRVVHEASLTESSLQSAARNLGVLARPMPCNLMADALVLPSRWRSSDRMCAASGFTVTASRPYIGNHPAGLSRASIATEAFRRTPRFLLLLSYCMRNGLNVNQYSQSLHGGLYFNINSPANRGEIGMLVETVC